MALSEPILSGSVYQLLETRSRTHAESSAIIAPGRQALNYYDLFQHIEATVRTLNALGIGRNDRVAVVMSNGPEMATAFLATATGSTCCPLNPGFRSSELEFYLSDLRAKAVIVQWSSLMT